jgi:hypothetical protein
MWRTLAEGCKYHPEKAYLYATAEIFHDVPREV